MRKMKILGLIIVLLLSILVRILSLNDFFYIFTALVLIVFQAITNGVSQQCEGRRPGRPPV